jgi:predicted transcriptional regulator
MTKETLTEKQKDVYAYVAGYIDDNGYAPTGIEISMKLQITTQAVDQHIKTLVQKGWLSYTGGRYRKIKLT